MGDASVVSLAGAASLDRGAVGGKAASLVQLVQLGLRVPPAFVITTAVHGASDSEGGLTAATVDAVHEAVRVLEAETGKQLGGGDPLLLAVRSGAAASMPGMMDTVLDVGFGPGTRAALAERDGEDFARSCHATFLAGYGAAVVGAELPDTADPDELARALDGLVPVDPHEQLLDAVSAVLRSWGNERARAYRAHHDIDDHRGTAVVVQAMVFGNRGDRSGSGVASSRDPGTGAPGLCGDFLPGVQGPAVVDGTHRPLPVAGLAEVSPEAFAELSRAVAAIEAATRDLVDVEFTVEDGVLHVLQHRPGARAAPAAVRIAVDLVDEGAISVAEALGRVSPVQLTLAGRPTVAPGVGAPLATGIGACPGVATGEVCLSADHVAEHDGPVILVRDETSPHDVRGLTASAGALTARGGLVSHAALVARELDLPTVVGVEDLRIDEGAGRAVLGGHVLVEGDVISVDGGTGKVHAGTVPVVAPAPGEHLARFRTWLAEHSPPQEPTPAR